MLGKKKSGYTDVPVGSPTEPESSIQIHTIPEVFYGGKNPAVYAHPKAKAKPSTPIEIIPEEETDTEDTMGPPRSRGVLWVSIIIISLLVVGGVVAYFLYDAGIIGSRTVPNPNPVTIPTPTVPTPTPVIPEPVEPEPEVPTTPEIVIPTSTGPLSIMFPNIILVDTVDLDFDGLTDEEELVFGTDPGIWDTDEDGYFDGQEVANLYNPSGFAPIRIIDAPKVNTYTNPIFGYQLYYPSSWALAAVDATVDEVLISSISGDYIAVYTRTKAEDLTLQDWIIAEAEGQFLTDLQAYENRFERTGFLRRDSLVAYFEGTTEVYVLVYYPADGSDVSYRAIMQMMVNSFLPPNAAATLPDQVVLPRSASST